LIALNEFVFVKSLLGILSISLLSLIPYRQEEPPEMTHSIWQGIKQSVREMTNILIKNIPYRHFQIGFMFYGFGFMGSYAVIILFWEFGLGLTAVRSLFAPLVGVLFYELWGFTIAFSISIISLLTGVGIMWWSSVTFPMAQKKTLS